MGKKTKHERKEDKDKRKQDPMQTIVKRCAREQIWSTTKFLDDDMINKMKIEKNEGYENSIVGMLMNRCMKDDLEPVLRLQFWRNYSRTVKDELNKMKTNCMKQIKMEVRNGM